jgi:hypothetical protein
MLRDTMESQATTGRQSMPALPTEPLEILRYALSEVDQTVCREREAPSIVSVSHILIEEISFLEAKAARVNRTEP